MSLPSAGFTKNTFATSQAPPDVTGVLAIIAASSTGTANQPGGYARSDLAVSAFGYGPLAEYAAFVIDTVQKPVVLVKAAATYAGSYTGLDSSGKTGTSTIGTSGTPYDTGHFIIEVVNGGTRGTTGITYTYSSDGGQTTSGAQALGTDTSIVVPNSGVTFTLGAGTLNAGDTWNVYTNRPLLNDADITTSLTALSQSRLPWEGAYIDCSASVSTVGLVDTLLTALEGNGQFKFVIIPSPFKLEPEPTGETEAAFAARMTTLFGNQTSIRMCVGADGAHMPSPITGFNIKRSTGIILGARAMGIPIGEDPAYVARGPIPGAQVADANGNPFDHDEDLYPNLDSLRLASLRSFAPGGPQGVYITNANTMQPTGGDWPYLQHIRIMNRACTIAWFILTTQLSLGVRKNAKADPVTGAVYIFEPDAARIENMVNDQLKPALKGQVTSAAFTLSRTDNLNVVPVTLTGVLAAVSLAYVKQFATQVQWAKTISTSGQ